jgi:DNA processing protein
VTACDACLRRAFLLARLGGHLDNARARVRELLALPDADLIAAVGGRCRGELATWLAGFRLRDAREGLRARAVEAICGCDERWPPVLRELAAPPAALFMSGGSTVPPLGWGSTTAAIVGTRRPSDYGRDVARSLARSLSVAGVVVISGLAAGIDAAAHTGAVEGSAITIAVVAGGPDSGHPASARSLRRRLTTGGGIVLSELPPGSGVRRWMFPARNRIIAALAGVTVVVEAGERSGSLVTAAIATELGRRVAAVPGRVTTPQAAGPNALLRDGATVVRSAVDVIELLGGPPVIAQAPADAVRPPPQDPRLRALLSAIAGGADTEGRIQAAGFELREALAGVAALELSGHVRRGAGGTVVVLP